ncbi:hypothetical protein D3C72_1845750 [compost metagenome]
MEQAQERHGVLAPGMRQEDVGWTHRLADQPAKQQHIEDEPRQVDQTGRRGFHTSQGVHAEHRLVSTLPETESTGAWI